MLPDAESSHPSSGKVPAAASGGGLGTCSKAGSRTMTSRRQRRFLTTGIGMAAHYAIGLVLGAGYALLLQVSEPRQNSLRRATAYGIATTAFSLVLDVPGTWPGCHRTSRRRSASACLRPVDAHRLRRWARGRTPMQGCDACETVSVSSRIDEAPAAVAGERPSTALRRKRPERRERFEHAEGDPAPPSRSRPTGAWDSAAAEHVENDPRREVGPVGHGLGTA